MLRERLAERPENALSLTASVTRHALWITTVATIADSCLTLIRSLAVETLKLARDQSLSQHERLEGDDKVDLRQAAWPAGQAAICRTCRTRHSTVPRPQQSYGWSRCEMARI